jgi:hypothetical protein
MAIVCDVNFSNGLKLNECYVKIKNVSVNKTDGCVTIQYFTNEEYRKTNEHIKCDTFYFNYDLNSTHNILTQAYNYLKTIDIFKDAKDV